MGATPWRFEPSPRHQNTLYTLSILLLGCVGCIHSPPLRTFSARRGLRSFAALPKNKLVRVYITLSSPKQIISFQSGPVEIKTPGLIWRQQGKRCGRGHWRRYCCRLFGVQSIRIFKIFEKCIVWFND